MILVTAARLAPVASLLTRSLMALSWVSLSSSGEAEAAAALQASLPASQISVSRGA